MWRPIAFLLCLFVAFQATAVTRYHQDNLNSSSALSGSGGSQLEVNVYYPFGRTLTASPQASFQVSRRFTGQVFDAESGLYWYNTRPYDPELGRFIQADTIIPDLGNPQSYNRYSYCLNSPLRYTDPSGHEAGYTYDATGMHSGLDSPEAAARMEWTINHVAAPSVNAAFWAMDKMDAGINSMRTSQNPFARGAGAGLWGASWFWGGGETKGIREARNLVKATEGVWGISAIERGIAIEEHLATTEYKGWFRVGQLDNGKFPLVDFQKGNNLVSLKTVNTTGSGWLEQMQRHIEQLGSGLKVNGRAANVALDLRVQPGGTKVAERLVSFGQKYNVNVIIKEIK